MKYLLFTGNVQLANEEYDEAIKTFERIDPNIASKDTQMMALAGIGDAYSKKHMDARAQTYYKNALEIKTNIPIAFDISFKLANSYLDGFNYEEALKVYKKIISTWTGGHDVANFKMGLCYEGQNSFKDALDSYEEVTKINPAYPDLYYRIGFCYKKTDNCKKATEALSRQLQFAPGDQKTYVIMADCQYNLEMFPEAISSYNFLLAKNEEIVMKDPTLCAQFAHLCLTDNKYFDNGLKFIEYGESHYDNVYFQFLKGEYYYLTNNENQFSTAKTYFKNQNQKDREIIKNDPVFHKLAKGVPELKVFMK
jgi:tetratricopeptide (TPR) repeat protein